MRRWAALVGTGLVVCQLAGMSVADARVPGGETPHSPLHESSYLAGYTATVDEFADARTDSFWVPVVNCASGSREGLVFGILDEPTELDPKVLAVLSVRCVRESPRYRTFALVGGDTVQSRHVAAGDYLRFAISYDGGLVTARVTNTTRPAGTVHVTAVGAQPEAGLHFGAGPLGDRRLEMRDVPDFDSAFLNGNTVNGVKLTKAVTTKYVRKNHRVEIGANYLHDGLFELTDKSH